MRQRRTIEKMTAAKPADFSNSAKKRAEIPPFLLNKEIFCL
jgi:hypothetical protein